MSFPTLILLDQIVAAGIPNSGLTIGRVEDRTTWRVHFLPEATAAHKHQAATIIQTFDSDQGQRLVESRTFLSDTDAKMARIAEDLIDHLVAKGVLILHQLPISVQEVLAARKNARAEAAALGKPL